MVVCCFGSGDSCIGENPIDYKLFRDIEEG
jgi:hypothetical protein